MPARKIRAQSLRWDYTPWILGLLLTALFHLSAVAQVSTNPPTTGFPLKVLNREVMVFRSSLGSYSPEQRAAAAGVRLEKALQKSGSPQVDSQRVDDTAEIRVHGQTVFFILPKDVNELQGETFDSLVQQTVLRLDMALAEHEEISDRQSLFKSALKGVIATGLLVGLIWLFARNRRWIENRFIRLTADKAEQIKSHSLRVVGLQNMVTILRSLTTAVFWFVTIISTFIWLEFMLRLLPITRPFGEQLREHFLQALGKIGQGALNALPDLGIVILVFGAARFASTAARRFFLAVARGNVKSRFFDPTTSPIAQRLFVILIWLTAVIVAFPYIPGSQTPAFRGISVLAGLMLSLGSSNLIAQIVGGLVTVYNRACRPGDYVRVGEHEGTVASIGFFTSRLITVRNEEITVPNSQISGGALINYSRLNETSGVALPVKISIGYSTPWRQVHAMLQEAARRTPGVKRQPAPTVLQNALGDFYIEYQLQTVVDKPSDRLLVLSDLHAHIQDVFNEYGVQIMSPHYLSDPPQPVLVPREQWHKPPAAPPA